MFRHELPCLLTQTVLVHSPNSRRDLERIVAVGKFCFYVSYGAINHLPLMWGPSFICLGQCLDGRDCQYNLGQWTRVNVGEI